MRGTLKKRAEFARVYEEGKKAVGAHLIAFALTPPRLHSEDPREFSVGVVASRKVGGAVQRNRAKRVLRAAVASKRDRLLRPLWLVLVARRSILIDELRSPQAADELEELLARLGCLKPVAATERAVDETR